MKQTRMQRSDGGDVVQAFPLQEGLVNLTTGIVTDITLVHCVANGNLIVNWATPVTIACTAGQEFAVFSAPSVEVSTGTFHLAK